MSDSPDPKPSGKTLGDFRIVREIGRGGMGVVYEAQQISLRRTVALKILPSNFTTNPDVIERFRREASTAARLRHPGIVEIYAVGEEDGMPFFAMEFIQGTPLDKVIARLRPDSPSALEGELVGGAVSAAAHRASETTSDARKAAEPKRSPSSTWNKSTIEIACRLMAQVADALGHAHEAGVIHRDVKPANILVREDGSAVLTDFGIAREEGLPSLTQTGDFAGTPYYVSPEQAMARRARVNHRTDIYSLGVTLFELLTLRHPFEGKTSQEVLAKILTKEPPSPKQFNPVLPRDLVTIVMKAIEKDPDRRYQSASSFAADLRAFLSFKPITARPAGPAMRAWKWARRNPAKAVTIAAAAAIVLGAGVMVAIQRATKAAVVAEHLRGAEGALAQSDFDGALASIERALERDPASVAARDLRQRMGEERNRAAEDKRTAAEEKKKQDAFDEAATSRGEAAARDKEYATARTSLEAKREEARKLHDECFTKYASTEKRAQLNRMEILVAAEEAQLEQLAAKGREALERSFRFESPYLDGKPSAETEAAFARYFLGRWKEALDAKEHARRELYETEIKKHDVAKQHASELLGRGTLTVDVEPGDADVFLFRYEPYETVRTEPPVVSRLVPVPTSGVGCFKSSVGVDDFYPGDLCLAITAVEPDSPAAKVGLRRGDLVIRVDGQPCGDGLFVQSVTAGGPAANAGVKPLAHIGTIDGDVVESAYDWASVPLTDDAGEGPHQLVISGKKVESPPDKQLRDALGLTLATPIEVVTGKKPAGAMTLSCLRDGMPFTLAVAAGERSGLGCEATAYPLILSKANRIDTRTSIAADPGSYVLFVRDEGFESQRFPIVVPRGGKITANVTLQPEGTTPGGFVYVPPGSFIYGGDPDAFGAGPKTAISLDGFAIARLEVTNREWFEFANDPETRRETVESARQPNASDASEDDAARYERSGSRASRIGDPSTPVLGISWDEIQAFLEWRNRKARAAGEKWTYELPKEKEWEKAARGVDGRFFPWGDRFDFSLCVSGNRKHGRLDGVHGGFEPRDESVYGVMDMGGSRYEWTASEWSRTSGARSVRGGSWGNTGVLNFRCAYRYDRASTYDNSRVGFRLVARPGA